MKHEAFLAALGRLAKVPGASPAPSNRRLTAFFYLRPEKFPPDGNQFKCHQSHKESHAAPSLTGIKFPSPNSQQVFATLCASQPGSGWAGQSFHLPPDIFRTEDTQRDAETIQGLCVLKFGGYPQFQNSCAQIQPAHPSSQKMQPRERRATSQGPCLHSHSQMCLFARLFLSGSLRADTQEGPGLADSPACC